jgi:polyisoprenyl-phosphate glycosyltransferase
MRHVDIICPVFQEEEIISLFNQRLMQVLDRLAGRYTARVLYVMDPGSDETEQVLREIARCDRRVEVLIMSRRFGHQMALVAGLDATRGDAAIMLDSDLQHPPELIPELLEYWENGAEIVQAIREDAMEAGRIRRAMSRWFYALFVSMGSAPLQPGAADFRLLSARVVNVFRAQLREHNAFIRGLVSWVGYQIVYIPFRPAARLHGMSKYRPTTLFNLALVGLSSFSKTPLRFCIGIGFALAGLGLLSAFVQIFAYFFGNHTVPGWASLLFAISLMGGVQLFFLGVIGEYIGLIIDEVKNRPRYLIDRRIGGQAAELAADDGTTLPLVAAGSDAHGRQSVRSDH